MLSGAGAHAPISTAPTAAATVVEIRMVSMDAKTKSDGPISRDQLVAQAREAMEAGDTDALWEAVKSLESLREKRVGERRPGDNPPSIPTSVGARAFPPGRTAGL